MANMTTFPLYGMHQELLGQAQAPSEKCGDTVWTQALALGAKNYSVSEDDIRPIGVRVKDQVSLLGVEESSNMLLTQVR